MGIYLDNAATTKLDPEVMQAMLSCQGLDLGNASSLHKLGIRAARVIEEARGIIAQRINATPEEVFFTSGGTESNNLALKGIAFANNVKGNHIITSGIEHPSILEPARWLSKHGFRITYLVVNKEGFIEPDSVKKAIKKETILVSIMQANNEVGTIEPIKEIGAICQKEGVYFHTDACQSFTKTELDAKRQGLDLATLNAHKVYGPKGIAALYIKKGVKLEPFLHGGGQEKSLRSGTYNTEAIVGFGKAAQIADISDAERMAGLRDYFIQKIKNEIEDVILNGPLKRRLCNNVNLTFKSVKGKKIFSKLNERNIFVSTSSACSSSKLVPSHVLLALGIGPELAEGAVRISLSKWTTKKELDFVIQNLKETVKAERASYGARRTR